MKLQSGDKACTAIWHHIMNVSKADLKKNYDNLNVHFDLWKGESDAQPYIPDMIQSMIDSGLAYESQGATVVDIQEDTDTKELPPCIIRKSDGAALYATSDLATLVEREKCIILIHIFTLQTNVRNFILHRCSELRKRPEL